MSDTACVLKHWLTCYSALCQSLPFDQIVVPAWPFYNKYQTKWLPNRPASPPEAQDKKKSK